MFSNLGFSLLFDGVEAQEIERLIVGAGYGTKHFAKGDVIALQGSRYNQLYILSEGRVAAENTDVSSNKMTVEQFPAPAIIAPSFLFAEPNALPVTIIAQTPVAVISIDKEAFLSLLMSNRIVLRNLLSILSASNKFISDKVVYRTYKTIKGKFANYLLNTMEHEGGTTFRNRMTQREMAEMFGVTRPALARAMGELVDEGTIFIKGKDITVLFAEKLRHYAKN